MLKKLISQLENLLIISLVSTVDKVIQNISKDEQTGPCKAGTGSGEPRGLEKCFWQADAALARIFQKVLEIGNKQSLL